MKKAFSKSMVPVVTAAVLLMAAVHTARASFPDVPGDHAHSDAIDYVQSQGIVSGYPDGTFRPDNRINRAEFTKIIISAVYDQATIDGCLAALTKPAWKYVFFPDASVGQWYAKYICMAKTEGVVSGYPDGTFKPEQNINFVEASKIIALAFGLTPGADKTTWYRPYVTALADKNDVPTDITDFTMNVNRGQMAEMTYRLHARVTDKPSLTYDTVGEPAAAINVVPAEAGTSSAADSFTPTVGVMPGAYAGTIGDGYSGITATTYYVAPEGKNSNPGTSAEPWASPGYGSRLLKPGDAMVIRQGRYSLSVYDDDIVTPPSGTAHAWITIKGEDGALPVLAGKGNLASAFQLSGASYVRIENLEITSDNGEQFREAFTGLDKPLDHITIKDVYVHHVDEFGIDFADVNNLQIINSDISYTGFGSIGGPAGTQGGWRNVLIKNCDLSYAGHYYQGVTRDARPSASSYDRPDGFGIEAADGPIEIAWTRATNNFGDGLDVKAAGANIHDSISANNYGEAVKLWRGDSKVVNTLLYGRGGGDKSDSPWVSLLIDSDHAGDKFEITNVTVDDNGSNYLSTIQYDNPTVPVVVSIRNSIFSNRARRGDSAQISVGGGTQLTLMNNLFSFYQGDSLVVVHGDTNLDTQQLNEGYGSGNKLGDAKFMTPSDGASEGDYHLLPGSGAIDAGTSEGAPPKDLDGKTRPQGAWVDMGAYESGGTSPAPMPPGGTPPRIGGGGGGTPPPAPTGTKANVNYMGGFPAIPSFDALDPRAPQSASLTINGLKREAEIYLPKKRLSKPPLLILLHGTNGSGKALMTSLNVYGAPDSLADTEGVVVIAPTARVMTGGDWNGHSGGESYWEMTPTTDPFANQDLLFMRAVIQEAKKSYAVDDKRIYIAGDANGGFFALAAATALRDQIAAFAENDAGLVTCGNSTDCRFRAPGNLLACSAIKMQPDYCKCNEAEKPLAVATTGRKVPGFLAHSVNDDTISVAYTCTLADRLQSTGAQYSLNLRNDADAPHSLPADFINQAWPFFWTHPMP